jgi:hypothetical protein
LRRAYTVPFIVRCILFNEWARLPAFEKTVINRNNEDNY